MPQPQPPTPLTVVEDAQATARLANAIRQALLAHADPRLAGTMQAY